MVLPDMQRVDVAREGRRVFDVRTVPLTWAPSVLLADQPGKVGPDDDEDDAGDTVVDGLLHLVDAARHDVLIVPPYFFPGPLITERFRQLGQRGVRVRVLTNSLATNDAPVAHAGYARYRQICWKPSSSCTSCVPIKRCRRAARARTADWAPLFLDQLTRTLGAEELGFEDESVRISGASGGLDLSLSEIGVSAAAHGKELLELGFSVDRGVHDYGGLCQAITDLALERDAAFSTEEFRTLHRCLDNAIADAVAEFTRRREIDLVGQEHAAGNERMGFLVHELRNALGTATLAISALETGDLPIMGSTGAVLKRSLSTLTRLIEQSIEGFRREKPVEQPVFDVNGFIADAAGTAQMAASSMGCTLDVAPVPPGLGIRGDRALLLAAQGNLLQNALKFTQARTTVKLQVIATARHVQFDVSDHCGGLPKGNAEEMFIPFRQRGADKSGLGLGLAIARQSIEADSGTLSVRNVPGVGCVFSIRMPRHACSPLPPTTNDLVAPHTPREHQNH